MSFVSYLGWVQALIAVIALVFGAVNIKDYFWYKEGISFTIGDEQKPGIYQGMRRILAAGDVVIFTEALTHCTLPWNALGVTRRTLLYAGRPESASPAAGSYKRHNQEVAALIEDAFTTGTIRTRRYRVVAREPIQQS